MEAEYVTLHFKTMLDGKSVILINSWIGVHGIMYACKHAIETKWNEESQFSHITVDRVTWFNNLEEVKSFLSIVEKNTGEYSEKDKKKKKKK